MQVTTITDDAWTLLGTGLSVCVLQFSGGGAVWVSDTAPGANDTGFEIKSGIPVELPQVSALGGGVWVKCLRSTGNVAYASA